METYGAAMCPVQASVANTSAEAAASHGNTGWQHADPSDEHYR